MNKYEDLKIWKKAMELVEEVYFLMKKLPDDEKFGLISQIKKSSVSIPSNIAEGAGRNSKKEFVHFIKCQQWFYDRIGNTTYFSLSFEFC